MRTKKRRSRKRKSAVDINTSSFLLFRSPFPIVAFLLPRQDKNVLAIHGSTLISTPPVYVSIYHLPLTSIFSHPISSISFPCVCVRSMAGRIRLPMPRYTSIFLPSIFFLNYLAILSTLLFSSFIPFSHYLCFIILFHPLLLFS